MMKLLNYTIIQILAIYKIMINYKFNTIIIIAKIKMIKMISVVQTIKKQSKINIKKKNLKDN